MRREDYIVGGHHFWIHFWLGLVLGTGLGLWLGVGIFDSQPAIIASTVAIALVIAYVCGRWGDPIWNWVLWCFRWFR